MSQLYWLNKETAQLQKELSELQQKDMYRSPVITDMPKGGSVRDSMGEYVAEKMILEDTIKLNMQKIFFERTRIENYISGISDSEVRLIMRLRHVNGMTWEEIGCEIGYTRQGVHVKYKRYLKKNC